METIDLSHLTITGEPNRGRYIAIYKVNNRHVKIDTHNKLTLSIYILYIYISAPIWVFYLLLEGNDQLVDDIYSQSS